MNLVFSTVIRSAPLTRCGEVVVLDWDSKQIVTRTFVGPSDPTVRGQIHRGNTRGGRGIRLGAESIFTVACYDKIDVFDNDLTLRRRLSNGLTAGLHEHFDHTSSRLILATALDAAIEVGLDREVGRAVIGGRDAELPKGVQASTGGIDPWATIGKPSHLNGSVHTRATST